MPSPSDKSQAIFKEQWLVYRKVIDHDYMGHAAIHGALVDFLANHPKLSASLGNVLDLGCGDAEISSALVGEFGCTSYLGVDASAMALEQAATKPQWGKVEPRFKESDLLTCVEEDKETFDVILAGFVLHHLDPQSKREFFRSVNRLLQPEGVLLFYDVFCLPGLDRSASVAEYLRWIRKDWSEINESEYGAIEAHIAHSDFPEDVDWIISAAREGGPKQASRLLTCAAGFHHVIAFSR